MLFLPLLCFVKKLDKFLIQKQKKIHLFAFIEFN